MYFCQAFPWPCGHLCKHPFISPLTHVKEQAFKHSLFFFITNYYKHTWIIHIKRCPRISFQHYRVWNTAFQSMQGSNEAWKMGQPHWKPWHRTKWKRKHKGPIGWILWMGAPYTCKWYTLSGHRQHILAFMPLPLSWMDFPEEERRG